MRGITRYVLRRGGGVGVGDRMARGCRLPKSTLASASAFLFMKSALRVSVSRFYILFPFLFVVLVSL